MLAVGNYHTVNPPTPEARTEFKDCIYYCLQKLFQELGRTINTDSLSEQRAAAKIHKEKVLFNFFRRNDPLIDRGEAISGFLSHATCFCCLLGAAEHPLPCGNVLCTQCILTYGERDGDDSNVDMRECPLEGSARKWNFPHRILLKPEFAGVRVMTLDG